METQNSVSGDRTTKDRGWQTSRTVRTPRLVATPTIDERVTEPVSRTAYRVQRVYRARCKFTRRLASSSERRTRTSRVPCPERTAVPSSGSNRPTRNRARRDTPESVDRWTRVRRNRLPLLGCDLLVADAWNPSVREGIDSHLVDREERKHHREEREDDVRGENAKKKGRRRGKASVEDRTASRRLAAVN